MATTKTDSNFFGEETKTQVKKKTANTVKTAGKMKRKYTRKVNTTTPSKTTKGFVTIEVPASIAFQLGVMLGSQAFFN